MSKTKGEVRSTRISVPVTSQERQTIEEMRGDIPVATFLRALVRDEARRRGQTTSEGC